MRRNLGPSEQSDEVGKDAAFAGFIWMVCPLRFSVTVAGATVSVNCTGSTKRVVSPVKSPRSSQNACQLE